MSIQSREWDIIDDLPSQTEGPPTHPVKNDSMHPCIHASNKAIQDDYNKSVIRAGLSLS